MRKSGKMRCRICGCTDEKPCTGGCYWVTFNVCSQCYEEVELRRRLKAAKKRKADAYSVIGAVSGFGEKRVTAIVNGAKPTFFEKTALMFLSEA